MISNAMLAGVSVEAEHTHKSLARMLNAYTTAAPAYIKIKISQADIDSERSAADGSYSDAYLETLAFYRRFCTEAAQYGVILFHSCVIEADGYAYLFAAHSGVGKSTHAKLWLDTLGSDVKILNGDKPLIRFVDGKPTAFGTPFMGKEGWGYNGSAPIGGICFLSRGENNSIQRITPQCAAAAACSQLFTSDSISAAEKIYDTAFKLINSVPLWSMKCNISAEAAEMSYKAMTDEAKKGSVRL